MQKGQRVRVKDGTQEWQVIRVDRNAVTVGIVYPDGSVAKGFGTYNSIRRYDKRTFARLFESA